MNNVDHARMFGFTASLWRGDKAEDLIKGLFGDVIATASYQEAAEHGMVVPIKAVMVPCKTREKQVTDSMMLDKKFNYICNYGRNELIAKIASEIPDEEQVLIMVSTFEHAVRLHELPQLQNFTVCHGGNGVKVKRNRPWTDETAPDVVTVISKAKGNVLIVMKMVNGLGGAVYRVAERISDFVTEKQFSKLTGITEENSVVDHVYNLGEDTWVSQPVLGKEERVYAKVKPTDEIISLQRLFAEYLKVDGSICGAPQNVDRTIGGADMSQYKIKPKDVTRIRRAFEEGTLKKLIATNIFSEGVNFKHLKYLIRADGEISKISNTQIPGRLSRLCEGKDQAYLIDFVDHFSPWAYSRSVARFNDYKESGWTKEGMPPRENIKED